MDVAEIPASTLRALRPIKAIPTPGIDPEPVAAELPSFRMVDPAELLIDEAYQRGLSERSIELIRKIVFRWDWRRFKPPVVAEGAQGLEIIDGQHTAIAAASHPDIGQIPVMVVEAALQSQRASAFIGHNKDRLGITPMQLHFAALAAGDPDAMTVDQVCRRAGLTVLKGPPANGAYRPATTVAIKSLLSLCNRRGAMKARIVLEALVKANCAPVGALQIKAAEVLLTDPEYAGAITPDDVTSAVMALGDKAETEARVFAATHKVPVWRGLAVVLFRRATRGRRRQD